MKSKFSDHYIWTYYQNNFEKYLYSTLNRPCGRHLFDNKPTQKSWNIIRVERTGSATALLFASQMCVYVNAAKNVGNKMQLRTGADLSDQIAVEKYPRLGFYSTKAIDIRWPTWEWDKNSKKANMHEGQHVLSKHIQEYEQEQKMPLSILCII